MDAILLKMVIRQSLLAILKQTQANHPDSINAAAMDTETRALYAWLDALEINWTE